MVVLVILGVIKLVDPLNNNVPPVDASYHLMVPVPDADNPTVPAPHLAALVPVGADGTVFIVAVTAVLVADTQPVTSFESNA